MFRHPVALVVVGAVLGAHGADTSGPIETVFYLGDPQIGFGNAGWQMDEERFASAARSAENATAVVVAGDLVNVWDNKTLLAGFDEVWPTRFGPDQVKLVPGNHDIDSNSHDVDALRGQLDHYRQSFGQDYHSFTTQHATFIMVNSEMLIAPHLGLNGSKDVWLLNETEAQWAWLEATLSSAARSGTTSHTVVVCHHPPFVQSPDEPHVYWNWPLLPRSRLLKLLAANGVETLLCGHTHTTTNVTHGNLTVYTVAGTARAFDHLGCGYRVLRISPTSIETEYIRQDDPSVQQCNPTAAWPAKDAQPTRQQDAAASTATTNHSARTHTGNHTLPPQPAAGSHAKPAAPVQKKGTNATVPFPRPKYPKAALVQKKLLKKQQQKRHVKGAAAEASSSAAAGATKATKSKALVQKQHVAWKRPAVKVPVKALTQKRWQEQQLRQQHDNR